MRVTELKNEQLWSDYFNTSFNDMANNYHYALLYLSFQDGPKVGRNNRVTKLLDVLPLRGASTFEKFCDSPSTRGSGFYS